MDQIGKLYQNRAMVLQEEINRLEKLLEAQAGPELTKKEQQRRVSAQRDENPNSPRTTVVAPASTSVKADGGLKLSPDYNKRDPLKADLTPIPQDRTGFELARTIQNIPNLPGQFYDKHPLLSLGLAAYSMTPAGSYRALVDAKNRWTYGGLTDTSRPKPIPSWKSSTKGTPAVSSTQAAMDALEALNDREAYFVTQKNAEEKLAALSAKPPHSPPPETPLPERVSVRTLFKKPEAATPSTALAGSYKTKPFPELFEKVPKPNIGTAIGDTLGSVGREIFQAIKPGGFWGTISRTRADSRNDILTDRYLSVDKPSAEADITGHQTQISDADLIKMRQQIPNIQPGPDRDLLQQTADELEQSIKANQTKQTNLQAKATAGEKAIKSAAQQGVPRLSQRFNAGDWAKRYLNPFTKMGARNIGKGAAGLVGDLVAGEATERGLRSVGVENEDVIGLARGGVGGAAGVATVLGLGGAAITAPAVLTGAAIGAGMYGAHRLGRAAMEDIKIPFTGNSVDDYISGISAIRKTPGITRAELDRLHPYKETTGGSKK